jgi:hypothetical protein
MVNHGVGEVSSPVPKAAFTVSTSRPSTDGEIVCRRVDRGSLAGFFEGDDAGGQSAATEEELSRGHDSIGHGKMPRDVVDPTHPEKVSHVHDVEGYRSDEAAHFGVREHEADLRGD